MTSRAVRPGVLAGSFERGGGDLERCRVPAQFPARRDRRPHPNVGAHAGARPDRVAGQDEMRRFWGFPTSDATVEIRRAEGLGISRAGSIYGTPPSRGPAAGRYVLPVTARSRRNVHATPTGASERARSRACGPRTWRMRRIRFTPNADGQGVPPMAWGRAVRTDVQVNIGATAPLPSAGAFEVHGAIREKYLALGAEASILGYPRTNETGTPDGTGRYNHFQAGSIYWTPARPRTKCTVSSASSGPTRAGSATRSSDIRSATSSFRTGASVIGGPRR